MRQAVSKPGDTRRIGRPGTRWLRNVGRDRRILRICGWKQKQLDRGGDIEGQGLLWPVIPQKMNSFIPGFGTTTGCPAQVRASGTTSAHGYSHTAEKHSANGGHDDTRGFSLSACCCPVCPMSTCPKCSYLAKVIPTVSKTFL